MTARNAVATIAIAGRIATSVARERFLPQPPLLDPAVVPPSAEALTPEWLTAVLCSQVAGARVVDVTVSRGDNGTSARRALVVDYNDIGRQAGLPATLFTKSTATIGSRILLGVTGIAEGESVFYNNVRPGLTLRSPRAYYSGYDPKSHRSLVILEDLNERGWTFPDPMANVLQRSDAEDMVSELAVYHGAFWDSPRFGGDLSRLRPAYDWQENLNRKVGFEKRTLTGLDRAKDVVDGELYGRREKLYPAFMRSLLLHRSTASTLLHQDLHLGNWLRDENGRMGLYDWQCVAKGNWALDYSYALGATLPTEDRRNWQEDLLRLYLARLKEAGVATPPTFDEAWLAYRQQPMHALAFGLFTLGGSRLEPELQPRDYTLASIERLARHVCDLGSIDALTG
ncbi:phosphotransferase [Mycobacterium hackensackense]|uniref:aminoglycoside phosphotransferase family protein n=1 Tax=Mycobacterium hackensackense TaxID=228909 RepID=UPI002265CC78|nr:aminoglycoside phosphotransferase family protein [Mycobacterium hackensackense]MCV7250640.1 phosphotransferase [Mycobacterium hackensackense]